VTEELVFLISVCDTFASGQHPYCSFFLILANHILIELCTKKTLPEHDVVQFLRVLLDTHGGQNLPTICQTCKAIYKN